MPRARKPARLWQRKSGARAGEWIILDKDLPGGQRGTGAFGEGGRTAAEAALAGYLSAKPTERPDTPKPPSEVSIGYVLELYADDIGDTLKGAGAVTLASCIDALGLFWGDLMCDSVKGTTCRSYERYRGKPVEKAFVGKRSGRWSRVLRAGPAKVRRELGVLNVPCSTVSRKGP